MLELLPTPRVDPLWAVAAELGADARSGLLDLVVGVYRDESGDTPVLKAVREAELQLAAAGGSKKYRGLSGNPAFNDAVTALALGSHSRVQATAVQSVAGTGALRLLAELVAAARPGATAWISDPGYVNHEPVLRAAGLSVRTYPYLRPDGQMDGSTVLARLDEAEPGDVVVVQASCHNPTGADPTPIWWSQFADLAAHRGLVPLVDMAYQGFGQGLEEDAEGLRILASRVGQVLVAVSCSKNFGLYSERTGCAIVVDAEPRRSGLVRGHLETIARAAYSQPPDHGAAVVAHILADPTLRSSWEEELGAMRRRIADIRALLALAFKERGLNGAWAAVGEQHGLFSTLPLVAGQVRRLRTEHGVYASESGRVNLAGLRREDLPRVADAFVAVGVPVGS